MKDVNKNITRDTIASLACDNSYVLSAKTINNISLENILLGVGIIILVLVAIIISILG